MKEGDDKCYFVVTRGCIDIDLRRKVVDAYFVELSPCSVGQTRILEGDILAEKRTSVVVERARAPVEEGGVIGKQQGGTDDAKTMLEQSLTVDRTRPAFDCLMESIFFLEACNREVPLSNSLRLSIL